MLTVTIFFCRGGRGRRLGKVQPLRVGTEPDQQRQIGGSQGSQHLQRARRAEGIQRGDRVARDCQVSKISYQGRIHRGLGQYNEGIEWRVAIRSVKFISGADPSGVRVDTTGDRVARGCQVSRICRRADLPRVGTTSRGSTVRVRRPDLRLRG